ncbi:M4 family metallopeptidase [Brachybacterium saurashtrense]|uniref:Neutral metalloproteinase n=1 Tax=Brachybacterium saurashtrense TaxID=556288 RepID=A0A345YRA8_9MICO|nr:M4 family metallopeptidase [Brachybacterium saurashtrense]AXK46460.1 M4 family peptidase [Brachybacterium saurashtrense]RRR24201.1 M4 family peptidase [Brachybacterium saurashtrense]
MHTGRDAPHTACGIVPPHLLRQIARAETASAGEGPDGIDARDGGEGVDRAGGAAAAARTLEIGRLVARSREVRAVRTGRVGPPSTAAGLVPPHLQQRLRGPRPMTGEGAPPSAVPHDAVTAAARGLGPRRSIHDAGGGTALPGALVRGEGGAPTGDDSADEAYDGLGATWELYHQAFSRDSLDDRGMGLIATVHYGQDFLNAFWDGEQMIFGDGDGVHFRSFTNAVDVIGHELTHGVVQYTAGLIYVAQPGALHESIADCAGAMVKQRLLGQSAEEADWLIGEGLFTERVQGVALRSMKAPGTAYDDPVLGTDPQPASMEHYADLPHDEENDNGGVHINSGIPNRAFFLAATGIGGTSWEGAGPLWYEALTGSGLPKDADFATFAAATLAVAADRHGQGSSAYRAVEDAWQEVGVRPGRR